MPINTHCAIKWSADNPMEKMPEINDAEWHIVHKGRQVLEPREADNESLIPMGFVAAKGSIPVNNQILSSVTKRKTGNLHVSTNKQRKLTDHMHPLNVICSLIPIIDAPIVTIRILGISLKAVTLSIGLRH